MNDSILKINNKFCPKAVFSAQVPNWNCFIYFISIVAILSQQINRLILTKSRRKVEIITRKIVGFIHFRLHFVLISKLSTDRII